jgi:hypothetical protein
MDVETWVDRQIREAAARGDFDDLPLAGKPLPGRGVPDAEDWWLKGFLRREEMATDTLLPPGLRLRKQVEELSGTVARLRTEAAVRAAVEELNELILDYLRAPLGPWRPLAPVDVDDVVARWHAHRRAAARSAEPAAVEPARRPWWRRLGRVPGRARAGH